MYELAKLVKAFNFLSSFYHYEKVIEQFVLFAEFIQPQLIKEGSEIIREVCEKKQADATILLTIQRNKNSPRFLNDVYKPDIRRSIEEAYSQRGHNDEIYEEKYSDNGAIFDMIAHSVLVYGLSQSVY